MIPIRDLDVKTSYDEDLKISYTEDAFRFSQDRIYDIAKGTEFQDMSFDDIMESKEGRKFLEENGYF
jgi:hypothetical protein